MSDRETTPTAPRRSARERKQNKEFANGSNKRKRDDDSEDDVEGEGEDPDHVATDSASDNDGEEQAVRAPRAGTRGTRGKGTKGAARGTGTRRKKANAAADDDEANDGAKLARDAKIADDNALFNLILSPVTALQDTADNFLESLDNTPEKALAELINCVLRTCGCNSSVDSDQVMDTDGVVDALDEFTEGFKGETMPTYPIASKSPIFRKFRKSLAEFITRLITSAAELGALYASELMSVLQAWIVPLSGSQIRSFRHTATVIALYIETALCQVAASVDKELQVLSRQKEGERSKAAGRSKGREQELDAKTKEVNTRRATLKEHLKDIFNAVFVHRSRDHDATIRADCVHELGVWFTKHPSYFLESGFLPYLGKTLADQNTAVRLEAVKAILTLYSKKDYIVAVNHFTQTFKPRLVEMAVSDIDLSVRLNVIQVLLAIDQLGLLEDEEREQLCILIFGREPRVREAVAPFVRLTWAEEVDQQLVGRSMTEENADKEKQRAGTKCLAQLLIKWSKIVSEDPSSKAQEGSSDEEQQGRVKDRLLREPGIDKVNHDRIGLAVESLWAEMEFLQKWNGLLGLLLMDHTTGVEQPEGSNSNAAAKSKKKRPGLRKEDSVVEAIWRLNDAEEEVLLQVLIAALRYATEEAKARKKSNKSVEPDDENATLDDITLALIKALPRLFIKHQTDASRIANVMVIPQLMNINMYLEMRMISAYETLWDDVCKQFMTHSSPDVIRRAVGTIRHMLSAASLQNTNKKKIGELEEELAGILRGKAATAGSGGRRSLETATFNEDETQALDTTIYRVANLLNLRNMSAWLEEDDGGKEVRLLEIFTSLAERARLGNESEDKMIEQVISILSSYIIWKSHEVFSADLSSAEGHALQQSLKQQRDPIVDTFLDFVIGENSQVTEPVKRAAFLSVMNIHLVYCARESQDNEGARLHQPDLQMVLEEEVQLRLAGYIQGVIELYAEELEAEKKAARRREKGDDESDTEMDDDVPTKRKKKGRPKNGDAASKESANDVPSLSRLEKDYAFQYTIVPFIQAIRTDTIAFEHSSVVLSHFGRFGVMYDSLAKVLVEMLRGRWQQGDNASVATVVKSSMRGAFILRIDGQIKSEDPSVALARTFATHFLLRGAHLSVLGRLPTPSLVDIHTDLINYLVAKIKDAGDDDDLVATIAPLFRPLIHLVVTGTPPQEMLKLKEHLEMKLDTAGIEWSASDKLWDGLAAYDRKLSNAPKEKATGGRKRGRPKKGTMSEEDEVANALTDDAQDEDLQPEKPRKQTKRRTRPVHKRGAKDKGSGSSAASSEDDTEPELDEAPKPTGKARKQKKKAIEPGPSDEEEPEPRLVVLNGETPSPHATPERAPKGSARKRRRGSEEADDAPASQKKQKVKEVDPPPEENDDEDDFAGRRLKRIKR
ncbi:hypothetical protein M408DRAFT_329747 [Serendipita vermifera MAFF 305830]|uniref:SCD domain-containing protein n=1 Tax=Serendipita vermifera MAFF 305830 TaxID=933852 RepID=A0A0C2XF69_SERVB|nr:hypothetical protein M408DRAFT_329747 [Serendipita vermifera MAFF 305830]